MTVTLCMFWAVLCLLAVLLLVLMEAHKAQTVCPVVADGSALRITAAATGARIFFVGNSVVRELMFETYARLTGTNMTGDVHGRKYTCGNPTDSKDKFPNCPLYASTTNTSLGFHWYQHYVQRNREGYLEACANVRPDGARTCFARTCFARLFGPRPPITDLAVFTLNVADAVYKTVPTEKDRMVFIDALRQTFAGTSVFIIPCLYNMRAPNIPGPDTNPFLARLNEDTKAQLDRKIHVVEIQDICDAHYLEYYDALHQHPNVSRLIMDRVWRVLAQI